MSAGFASSYECTGWRLATEVEWEVAARAGPNTAFTGGDTDLSDLSCTAPGVDELGHYCGNASSVNAVTMRAPNAWGICDMHGNAHEWTTDSYVKSTSGGTDVVTEAGGNRTLHGGGWTTSGAATLSAARASGLPGALGELNGVRAVRRASRPGRCGDGILNGDEASIDCGGVACAACP